MKKSGNDRYGRAIQCDRGERRDGARVWVTLFTGVSNSKLPGESRPGKNKNENAGATLPDRRRRVPRPRRSVHRRPAAHGNVAITVFSPRAPPPRHCCLSTVRPPPQPLPHTAQTHAHTCTPQTNARTVRHFCCCCTR